LNERSERPCRAGRSGLFALNAQQDDACTAALEGARLLLTRATDAATRDRMRGPRLRVTYALRWLLPAIILFTTASSGCSYARVRGEVMRDVDLENRSRVHVVRHEKDERAIDQMIASRLERSGFETTSGLETDAVPEGTQAVVSYEDHWQWDMSNYLIVLRIDFRDPDTRVLLASGHAYRPSMERQTPSFMVDEIISTILGEG
jgi:hypothetical protein